MSTIAPVTPQTVITLYQGVDWDSSNANIRLFDNASQRTSYLSSHILQQHTGCSAVRGQNKVRVEAPVNTLLTANYMMYANNGIGAGARQMFCFVESVDYINVNTTEITYTIDWIQSFLFDIIWEECFVEREHVNDDDPGKHLLPEPVDTGEYVIQKQTNKTYDTALLGFFQGETVKLGAVNGMASALDGVGCSVPGGLGLFSSYLESYNETPENVVSLTMGITDMLDFPGLPSGTKAYSEQYYLHRIWDHFYLNGDHFYPKNNKLKTSPYQFFTVDNYMGEIQQFHWEQFKEQDECYFQINGTPFPKPCLEIYPLDYMGASETAPGEVRDVQQFVVTFDNFPQVGWASDTFRAWVSQYMVSEAIAAGASILGSAAAIVGTGGVAAIPAVAGAATAGLSFGQSFTEHYIHSRQQHGSIGSAGLAFEESRVGFRFTEYCIKPDAARRIDSFFTRYGYRVDAAKIPNVRGRAVVNYVKCKQAKVGGNIPVDCMRALESALVTGVSFWHTNNMSQEVVDNPII